MRCAICSENVERDPQHPPLGLIHSHSEDVYCGTGDGSTAILSRETIYERVETLKRMWAETTGEDPDDYALSGDDWRAGLSDYEADEIVILLEATDSERPGKIWTLTTENPNGEISTAVATNMDELVNAFEAALDGWVDESEFPDPAKRPISGLPSKKWERLARRAGFLTVEVAAHDLKESRR